MKILFFISASMFVFTGCTTSPAGIAKVNKSKGTLSLYSSGDKRTVSSKVTKTSSIVKSEKALKSELKSDPTDVVSLLNLARLQLAQGKLKSAESSCRNALRRDLKNREARKTLAQIYIRRDNYDMAEIILTGLGGEKSKDAEVLNGMALIALNKGRNAKSMYLFKRALKRDSSNVAVRMNMGVLMLSYRQFAQASTQFERVLKIMPENIDAKLHLAVIKAVRGENDSARGIYEDVLSQDKNNSLALYNLAVLQSKNKSYNKAIDNLKKYLKSRHGGSEDTEKAVALISEIQSKKDDGTANVSDEEIRSLAAKNNTSKNDGFDEEEEAIDEPQAPSSNSSSDSDSIESLEKFIDEE